MKALDIALANQFMVLFRLGMFDPLDLLPYVLVWSCHVVACCMLHATINARLAPPRLYWLTTALILVLVPFWCWPGSKTWAQAM